MPNKSKDTPETPPPPAIVKQVGKFAFAVEKGVEIPAAAPRSPSAVELPFKDIFGEMGHNEHFFVPLSFWTSPKTEGGRGVDPKKATTGYQRQKIRDAFNTWVKKDQEKRSQFQVILVPRQAGDDSGRFPEAGLSVFLQDKTKM